MVLCWSIRKKNVIKTSSEDSAKSDQFHVNQKFYFRSIDNTAKHTVTYVVQNDRQIYGQNDVVKNMSVKILVER